MTTSRFQAAEEAEGLRRLYRITIARSAALVASAGIILLVSPQSVWLYLLSIISLFIATGWLQYLLARQNIGGWWRSYAATAVDLAMLTFALIYPPPGTPLTVHPAFFLRFDSFDYLYIILAGLAISLRPGLLIWGGVCTAIFWSIGLWWLVPIRGAHYASEDLGPGRESEIALMADPAFIDLGVQFQGMMIFLIVAIMLAIAVEAPVSPTGQSGTPGRQSQPLPAC